MKKIFFSIVILISLFFLWAQAAKFSWNQIRGVSQSQKIEEPKKEILKFAVVADSENENDKLEKALGVAKSKDADFVVGLGDWSSLGFMNDLVATKEVLEKSGLEYYVSPGDRDLWDSRDKTTDALTNFNETFGKSTHVINKGEVSLIIVDNADIYHGISSVDWDILKQELECQMSNVPFENSQGKQCQKLTLVFSHKTPFHPQSAHIMGADSEEVANQANQLIKLMEEKQVGGFFSGDLHFFAKFKSPNGLPITTVGALNSARNFQGPRFAMISVFEDYSWNVEEVPLD